MRFKVLGGQHDQGDGKIYKKGDVVENDKPLHKLFPFKFQPLDEVHSVEKVEIQDQFTDLPIVELVKLAEAEEIDIHNLKTRAEVLEVIRKAFEGIE